MGNVSACNGIYDIHLRYSQYVDNFVVIYVVFLFFVSHTNEIHNFGALLGQRYLSVVAPCVLSRWGDGNGERQRQRNGNGNVNGVGNVKCSRRTLSANCFGSNEANRTALLTSHTHTEHSEANSDNDGDGDGEASPSRASPSELLLLPLLLLRRLFLLRLRRRPLHL